MSSKKAEARERVKAMREEQARQERRRERMMRFGVAGAIVVAVAIIAVAVAASRGSDGPAAQPELVSEDGTGIQIGDADAPVTIDYWMDFLCPHCKEFEDANGATISELVDSGQANVVYHPLTFTGGSYSTRANNAFACAADEGQEPAKEFLSAAFASQQQWSTDSLVDVGEQIGIGGNFESCVRDSTYDDWSSEVGSAAQENGVTATPTVYVNGEVLPNTSWDPEGIRNAVEAAAAGESITSPAPESEPTGGATGAAEPEQTPSPAPSE